MKHPKQGQNRLPRPLRLLQMPQRAFQSLLSTYLLFPIPLLLTLLLPCVFHVFSMDRVHKVVKWLNLTKLSLKLNRTHSRYLFEPRLHATVARRLTITETRVLKLLCDSDAPPVVAHHSTNLLIQIKAQVKFQKKHYQDILARCSWHILRRLFS